MTEGTGMYISWLFTFLNKIECYLAVKRGVSGPSVEFCLKYCFSSKDIEDVVVHYQGLLSFLAWARGLLGFLFLFLIWILNHLDFVLFLIWILNQRLLMKGKKAYSDRLFQETSALSARLLQISSERYPSEWWFTPQGSAKYLPDGPRSSLFRSCNLIIFLISYQNFLSDYYATCWTLFYGFLDSEEYFGCLFVPAALS